MINLHHSISTSESGSAANPIIEGGEQLSGESAITKSDSFASAFHHSKSAQVSPHGVKKLAAAVLQANDAPKVDLPAKTLLSSLSSEELMQALMTKSESSISTESEQLPESLQEWFAFNADSELSEDSSKNLKAVGLEPLKTSEEVSLNSFTDLQAKSEDPSQIVIESSVDNDNALNISRVEKLENTLSIQATEQQGDTALQAGTIPNVDSLTANSQHSPAAVNEQSSMNLTVGDISTEEQAQTLNATTLQSVSGTNEADSIVVSQSTVDPLKTVAEKLASNEPLLSQRERLNSSASVEPVENKELNDKAATDSKPISLLVSSSELKSTEESKPINVEATSVKLNNKLTETGISEGNLFNKVSAEQAIESTDVSRPLIQPEAAKLERPAPELPQAQAMLQKAIKLPEVVPTLSERIYTMIKKDIQHGFIRLDPPELGALEVRIQVTQETTQVQIVSQSPQVREALESQSIRLRESLAEQGLTLADLDVSDQSSESAANQSNEGQENNGQSTSDEGESQNIDSESTVLSANGLIDHYV